MLFVAVILEGLSRLNHLCTVQDGLVYKTPMAGASVSSGAPMRFQGQHEQGVPPESLPGRLESKSLSKARPIAYPMEDFA